MSFSLWHESRPPRSWLIFDVGQKMNRISIFILILSVLFASCATSPPQNKVASPQRTTDVARSAPKVGVDPRWQSFGFYIQRVIDTVQIQWERQMLKFASMPPAGSTVTVKFVMNDEGRIAQILNVDSKTDDFAIRACVSAITDRAPFGAWTSDMKAALGTQQEMIFTFYYQ